MTETVTLTVHGPFGAIDLVVPAAASVADVAVEYARQVRVGSPPRLRRMDGRDLPPGSTVHAAGLRSGALLSAGYGDLPPRTERPRGLPEPEVEDGAGAHLRFVVAAVLAVVSGWFAATTATGPLYDACVAVLGAGALVGILPFGRHVDLRGASAPAFGAAATFALVGDPDPGMLPLGLGISALAAAVVAGIARALGTGSAVVHNVWMLGGTLVSAIAGAGVLLGLDPRVTWSLLSLVAVLAARSVAGQAVDVPDQMLLDLERLAVTAWSARERPRGRRGRIVIRSAAVSELLARGSHIVNAAAVAIFVVSAASTLGVLASTPYDVDHIGARVLVFFAGAALLLAARSYRHPPARALLRLAGVVAWAALAGDLLVGAGGAVAAWTVGAALVLAVLVMVAAIATGRGWRSVTWARRAEVAETLSGAFVVAAVVVSSGLFREIWELPFGG